MAYASNSFGGGCPPTYLITAINSSDMTATFADITSWFEVDAAGARTIYKLGTSGSFCIKLDYGLATEETVKCTSLDSATGVITFAVRGFDGTTAHSHAVGSASKLNVFPTDTATDWVNIQATATAASTTASSALSTANSKLPLAGGIMTGAIAMSSSKITGLGNGTASTDAATFGQIPVTFPPSGSAGGDLAGTYPNPTLGTAGTAGTYGSASLVPIVTTDAKGRVTAVTTAAPVDSTKLALTGGTMTGAIAMSASKITGLANGTVSTDAAAYGQIPVALPPSGSAGGDLAGTYPNPTLGTTGTPGTYGSASAIPVITTDSKGRVTAVTATTVQIAESQVTSLVTDLAAKAATTTTISTTAPLAGGGDLSANRTITIADATTAVKGAVQLTDSTSSTSTTTAATPNSVKTAYDLANAALPKAGGTMSGAIAMGASKITGLANGTVSTDAAAYGQIPVALPPNGSAGGDLAGTYPNPTLATAGTAGTYGSASLVPVITTDSKGRVTVVTTTAPLDATKLPLAGGTMSGAIAMGSNRITGLPFPGATTDPLIASQSMGTPSPSVHTSTYAIKAWNGDPANSAISSATVSMTSGNTYFAAVTIPYPMTLNQIWIYQSTGAAYLATGGFYALGIYDTSGNLLATTGNMQPSGFTGFTGPLGWGLTASYAIAQGNYMIGFLYYTGTGSGTAVIPVFGRIANGNAPSINLNCPTPSAGKLDQRCCSAGSGRTSLYSPMTATPVQSATNFWVAVA